jgi:hypothetical protein
VRKAPILLVLVAWLTLSCREASAAYVQTTFQIGGIVTDIPADTTVLERIHEAGIDWVAYYGWHYATLPGAAEVTARLELLRTHRAGFVMKALSCYQVDRGEPPAGQARLFLDRRDPPSRADVDSTLSPTHGINGPSTLGYMVWDEPDPHDTLAFANIGRISRWIASNPNTADKLAFTNLYCSTIGPTAMSDSDYEAYLQRYLDLFDATTPAPLLSFDEYPFQVPEQIERNWFRTLRLVRDASSARASSDGARVPWQAMIQLSPFRRPTDERFPANFGVVNTRWQAYTAIAYGAKGICYYQLGPAASAKEVWGPGIIDRTGDTVATRYAEIRALDADLHRLGPWLMRLDPVYTDHADTRGWAGLDREVYTTHFVDISFEPDADSALVGHLYDRTNGDRYLVVVNKAVTAEQSFTLTFRSAVDSLYRIDRATGAPVLLGTSPRVLRLSRLAPGQGELFRVTTRRSEVPHGRAILPHP